MDKLPKDFTSTKDTMYLLCCFKALLYTGNPPPGFIFIFALEHEGEFKTVLIE